MLPTRGRVLEVRIFSGNIVNAVQMRYILPDGRILAGPRHGGPDGQQNTFRLDSDEYIIGISGRYGANIDSLQIHTNKRASALFGGSGGNQDYRIDAADGSQAVGFVGRASRYLNAIGLTFIPLTILQVGQTSIFGGAAGSAFSDDNIPLGAKISEIRVRSGRTINAIQAAYILPDGRLFEGPVHGGGGGRLNVFPLDSNEYVIGISGRYGDHIDSLSIQTNKRTSQVFGRPEGNGILMIKIPAGNKVVGVAGRSGTYLNAIGLNYATVVPSQKENPRSGRDRDRIRQ